MLKLIKPSLAFEEQINEYKKAFQQSGESMDGSSYLNDYDTVEEWVNFLELVGEKETVPENLTYAKTWIVVDEGHTNIVGMANLRMELSTDYLKVFGGHIGYSVHPNQRKKGYGTKILAQTLEEAKTYGLNQVLVTCNATNLGSKKIIEANHGKLEKIVSDNEDQERMRRYWISL